MAESQSSRRSRFSTRSQVARIRVAAALEAANYSCTFSNLGDAVFLLTVEHEPGERETVRRIVFDSEPDSIVGLDE
jgi:hypothetical protein